MLSIKTRITPLSDNRQLSLYIDTFETGINSISYELRSTDGSRLIESAQLQDYSQQTAGISADIQLKDLIEPDEEYELILLMNDAHGRQLRYYTRVIQRSENHVGEEIRFVKNFHEKTFDKEQASELAQYMETDETGDNTSYSYVNIHSNFNQITWGDLKVEKITEPQITITELFPQTARICLSYYVKIMTDNGERRCRVDEYYRLRYGIQRIYLLNYERTMTEVFEMERTAFNNDKIDLGIRDADVKEALQEMNNSVICRMCRDNGCVERMVANALMLERKGDRQGAIEAYRRIDETNPFHLFARAKLLYMQ